MKKDWFIGRRKTKSLAEYSSVFARANLDVVGFWQQYTRSNVSAEHYARANSYTISHRPVGLDEAMAIRCAKGSKEARFLEEASG